MKFTFLQQGSGRASLRVIQDIPDYPICRIEGRNGIGKTLAIRLLELVSGATPFLALPHAWDSLVDQLGQLRIEIDTVEGTAISCVLDSASWHGKSQKEVAANPGVAEIDGNPASWTDVRQLVHVRRIAGDESLQDTLGRILRERAIGAYQRSSAHAAQFARWGTEIGRIARVCGAISPEQLDIADYAISTAETAYDTISRGVEDLGGLVESLATRKRKSELQVQQVELLPALIEQYRTDFDALATAVAGSDEEERRMVEAAIAVNSAEVLTRDLQKWSRLLELRLRAVDRADADVRHLQLTARGHDDETPTLSSVRDQLEDVNKRIEDGYSAGAVRGVLRDASSPLQQVARGALLDRHFITIDRAISGRELLTALERRRAELQDVPKPEETGRLERQAALLRSRIDALGQLGAAREAAAHKAALVDEAVEALDRLNLGLIEAGSPSMAEVLSRSRRQVVQASGRVASLHAHLRTLLGDALPALKAETTSEDGDSAESEDLAELTGAHEFPTPDAVDRLATQALDAAVAAAAAAPGWHAHFTGDDAAAVLANAVASASGELEDARVQLAAASAQQAQFQEDLDAARRHRLALSFEVRSAADALVSDQWGEWNEVFARAFGGVQQVKFITQWLEDTEAVEPDGAVEHRAASSIAAIRSALEAVEDAAGQDRTAWDSIQVYLESTALKLAPRLGAGLDGPQTVFADGPAFNALRSWTERELAGVLSSEPLRRELFDNASQVTLDLDEFALEWEGADGRRRFRPLEAFSSGEQVFAYTRAKLEEIAESGHSPSSTVIVLDEFGAFVARDRFGELMQYVQDEALGVVASQVIVMLPLSAGAAPPGSDAEEQLSARSYFAVPGMEMS